MRIEFNSSEQRSNLMKKIKSCNTEPEIILRKALWAKGIRYRKYYDKLPGKPDIVIIKAKVAVFVDGEFWHGYNWDEKKPKIKANREYWIPKIERNINRDKEINKIISEMGWTVLRFWEHDIRKNLENCVSQIYSAVTFRDYQASILFIRGIHMNLRLVKLDELQFLTCFKHGLWGANNNRFGKWQTGDLLAFKVGDEIAGLASVAGESFVGIETVWDNGKFPYRLPIKFLHILSPENRIDIEEYKWYLIESWGINFGWGILNQTPLNEEVSEKIYKMITNKPNSIKVYQTKIDQLIEQTR